MATEILIILNYNEKSGNSGLSAVFRSDKELSFNNAEAEIYQMAK